VQPAMIRQDQTISCATGDESKKEIDLMAVTVELCMYCCGGGCCIKAYNILRRVAKCRMPGV